MQQSSPAHQAAEAALLGSQSSGPHPHPGAAHRAGHSPWNKGVLTTIADSRACHIVQQFIKTQGTTFIVAPKSYPILLPPLR